MSRGVGGALVEPCVFAPNADVVDREIPRPKPGPRAISSSAPAEESRIGTIVEHTRHRQDEPHGGGIQRPPSSFDDEAGAVETAAYVQPFSGRDQPTGTEPHLVTAKTQRHRAAIAGAQFHVDERLMQIECVLVGRPRSPIPTVLQTALDLDEGTDTRAEVPIRMQQVSLKRVPVGVVGLRPESWFTHLLVPPTRLAAYGEVPVVWLERDVLDCVPAVLMARSVFQPAPVLVVAVLLVGGARVRIGGRTLRTGGGNPGHRQSERARERTGVPSAALANDHVITRC